MKKAALYIRVSTDAQFEEGYSVEAQKEMLEGYCRSKGIRRFEFYIDGGFTGSNIDRPEMRRLIEEVKAGQVSQVVVYKLDRLSRSQKDTLYLIEDVFNPCGVSFTSLNENLDTGTPMGRAMLGILSAFAQLERETIRERTRMGMLERVKQGYWMGGGHPPFGYDYDPEQGVLVPNADAERVRKAYSLYLEGFSAARIAEILGFRHDKQVRDLLRRRSNLGLIEYNGQEYPGRHQPIVPQAQFDRVQEMLERRSENRQVQSDRLLTGLVYCGRCGARMRYQKWGDKGDKLSCYSQQSSKKYLIRDPDCDNPKPWAREVEQAVLGDLFARALAPDSAEAPKEESVLDTLLAQKSAARAKLGRLYALYAAAEDDVLLESIQSHKRALERLEQRIARTRDAQAQAQRREEQKKRIRTLADAWPLMTLDEQRSVLRELIERIEVDGDSLRIDYRD